MKIVKKDEVLIHENSKTCIATEYPSADKDINVALVKINGRYPEVGYALNEVCKELAFINEGEGKIVLDNGNEIILEKGDSILIEPGEEYYWQGSLILIVSCTPAWYPEQHKKV